MSTDLTEKRTGPDVADTLRAHPRFVRVWLGQASGAVGDQLLPVALSLYVLHAGGGVAEVGLVLGGRAVSLVLCLLVGGVLADRLKRTRILFGADLFRAVLILTAAAALPWLPLTAVPLLTMLMGAGEAMSRPAARSLIPTLLPDALLERGNALVAAAHRSSAVLGALLGVSLVALIGTRWALALAGVVFALGALTVLNVPEKAPGTPEQRRTVLADAAHGLRAVRRRPWAMAVMFTVCLHLFAGTATALTLLPVISRDHFGGDVAYGVVLASMAVGALPAIVVAGRWRPRSPGTVAMLVLTVYALVPVSLAAPFPLAGVVVCFALGGFVVELYFVYWASALQRTFPGDVLGKVFALDQLSAYALLPLGYALVGPVVGAFGTTATLLGGGVLVAASSLLCLLVPGVAQLGGGDRTR
ncbi:MULTISPECIES: MFS transporter [Streptomyces]|uniref:MFS transporter n=1 Tax=Streptomyces silvae TaxID=2803812 RepID=A0ABU8AAC6_9ACTN|nr:MULTISPECIES: MFS transporter [unclassified Streptomyces]MDX3325487.1 MFS transporter [Streptomyces sp. ME02-6979-3A]WSS72196.1 MFS transporter [Streptomyces sp. NBC_01175]